MLFKDLITLKKYCQYAGTGDFPALQSSLRTVEYAQLVPILGKVQYNALHAAITAAANVEAVADPLKQLLIHCLMAEGPLFCYHHADKADVNFSDSGMQRVESTNNKSAYQEQRTKFKEANLAEGEQALEMLIEFLETNAGDYPLWTASDNFKEYRSLFIKSGAEFNKFFPSQSPHRNYWAMRTKMQDVEENNIRAFLGDTLFDALKEKSMLQVSNFTLEEKNLLHCIKKAIANFTVAFATPLLNVRITGNGITIPAVTTFSTNDAENTRAGISDSALTAFIVSCNGTGTDWLNRATNFLKDNKISFPSWKGFATTTISTRECSPNEGRNGTFGLT